MKIRVSPRWAPHVVQAGRVLVYGTVVGVVTVVAAAIVGVGWWWWTTTAS